MEPRMKKLEPGCKAMVVFARYNKEDLGKVFTVLKYCGKIMQARDGVINDVWLTSDGRWAEECLMRIDDDANIEDKETQREKSWSQ